MSPQKHKDAERIGGPGASHESRRAPGKSMPHGEMDVDPVRSGNASKREQDRPFGEAEPVRTDPHAGRADAGASSVPQRAASARGSINRQGHTAKKDPTMKPKERRQVR